VPFPEDDVLFINASIYEWEVADELSIAAYYVGDHRRSFDVATKLLEVPSLPDDDRERILANRDFAAHFVRDDFVFYPESIIAELRAASEQPDDRPQITLTVTSCRRYDLFERTINSFLNCCSDRELIGRWICIDTGSSSHDRSMMKEKYPFFEFVFKGPEDRTHVGSMNILLDMISSPYWLHLEDDWQFIVTDNYITKSLGILEDERNLGQVLFNRNYGETLESRTIHGGHVKRTAETGIRYRVHEYIPTDSPEYEVYLRSLAPDSTSNAWWPHYSLRPSLLRMSAIRKVGAYDSESGHFELDFAHRYTALGYSSAFLDSINALHIGRLTSERGHAGKPNAYDLMGERQFERVASGHPARVKLLANWTSSGHLCDLWNRQAHGNRRWAEIEMTDEDTNIDYWVIVNFPQFSTEEFRKDRAVVFQMEPWAGVSTWGEWSAPDPREFLQVRGHNRYRNNSEWHLDLSYSQLLRDSIEKTRELSCVTSGKTQMPGQQLRILFLKYLEECQTPIDIFGADNLHNFRNYHGTLPSHNKSDGILPYRYTIAIENSAEVNYFTEKIIDAIVGECLCFYWGCPNIEDYIDPAAFIRLPFPDFEESRRIIARAIEGGEHGRRLEAIRREKRRILDHYQFLPTMARIIRGHRLAERLTIKVLNLDRRP
ncbi:MAG: glycosyltransferase family 10, partial [Acidobacteriota bacterium]